MTREAYNEAIKTAGKFVIMVDNGGSFDDEVLRVFDTPEEAHEYASGRIKHTKNNKIDIYSTTGIECRYIDGIKCRNDIEPYQEHHIGLNW